MDSFDEHVMRVLKDGRPRDFHQLLEEVGFSHNTLRLHLNTLVEKGRITRETMPAAGPGRPKFIYSKPSRPRRQASSPLSDPAEVVTLTFKGLKRLCRFQRGGRCRELKDRCEAQKCPKIRKNE